MRKNFLFTILNLIFFSSLTVAQINTPSTASVPFGSNTSYEFGMMPTNLPSSGAFGQATTVAEEYNEWKTNLVEACPNGQYRVKFDNSSQTVSEGIGYGMLLAAYAADKDLFDGLWKYYQANANGNGFMNWKINGCSGVIGSNGASDADVDAAMALVVAATQWPDNTSPNYTQDAVTMINRIKDHEINTTNYTLENGDIWKPACRNPSYQPPGYFRVWKEFMAANGQNQDAFWDLCIQGTENLLTTNAHASSGLPSNWSNPDGQLNSSCSGSGTSSTGFGYDAIRAPWRVATAELWYGTSSLQTILNKQADFWMSNGGASSVSGERNQDGSGGPGDHNGTFVGMCGAASLGAAYTPQRQSFVNAMYTENLAVQAAYNPGYFNNTLRLIGLFVQSGNFWNPITAGVQCAKPDLGETVTICGAGSGIVLNSGLTTANNRSFTWKKDGTTISGANSPTYTATAAGTYTVVVDSLECSKSAEVEVTGTLPTINLGSDISLCDPASVTLNAGVSGSGLTYQWKRDGSVVSTASSISVSEEGTYSLTVSASGCTSQSDEVEVTSSLPEVKGDTICESGTVNLSVLSSGGPFEWFTSETGGSAVHTGITYSPSITSNKTYYVKDAGSIEQMVGPSSASNPLSGSSNAGVIGVRLTAETAFEITSVKILPYVYNCNPNDKVTLSFQLKDGSNNEVGTYTATAVDCEGAQSGPFNTFYTMVFDSPVQVPSAGDYTLVPNGGNQLVWYESGASYSNYSVSGVMNITGDTRSDKASSFPGIFDIQVSTGSDCARRPVYAVIDPSATCEAACSAPSEITFNQSNIQLCEGETFEVVASISGTANDTYYASVYKSGNEIVTPTELTGSEFKTSLLGNVSESGVYTVRIEDGNEGSNGCFLEKSFTVVVNAAPTANITSTELSYCAGENGVTLSAEAVTGASYEWSNGATTREIAATAGTYKVEVSLDGCSSTSSSVEVEETPAPIANITSTDLSYCEGGNGVTLSAEAVTGASYEWSNGATTREIAATAGTYTVEVSLGTCSSTSSSVEVEETPAPVANITSTDLSYCEGGNGVTLSAEAVTGASYEWSNGATTREIAATAGTYTVEVSLGTCSSTSSSVEVIEKLLPEATITTKDLGYCEGENGISLKAKTISGASYLWSNGAKTITINNVLVGTYSVTVTKGGCSSTSEEVNVTKGTLPEAQIITTKLDYCEDEDGVNLEALEVSGANYIWNNGSEGRVINAYAGFYQVTVSIDGCNAQSAIVMIKENTLPVITISGTDTACVKDGNTEMYTATSTGLNPTYVWSVDQGAVVNGEQERNAEIQFSASVEDYAYVTVDVIDDKGCENTSSIEVALTCDNILFLPGESLNTSLELYPNPYTEYFTIKTGHTFQKAEVFDMSGVYITTFNKKEGVGEQLERGAYLVKIHTSNGIEVRKLIKH